MYRIAKFQVGINRDTKRIPYLVMILTVCEFIVILEKKKRVFGLAFMVILENSKIFCQPSKLNTL